MKFVNLKSFPKRETYLKYTCFLLKNEVGIFKDSCYLCIVSYKAYILWNQ